MKAIEITEFGAPEVLKLARAADAAAESGRGADQGGGFWHQPAGRVSAQGRLCAAAGRLGSAGAGSGGRDRRRRHRRKNNPFGLKIGDRVCALLAGGGYAEYAAAPLLQCLPVPKGLSDVEAASLPETFFTVWSNVFDRAQLGKGEGGANETLLVQGGSSGIGVTAIQIAHALGFSRVRNRRLGRKVPRVRSAGRRTRDQLQDGGLRRSHQVAHERPRRRRDPRHGGGRLRVARTHGARRRRAHCADRAARRREGGD